MNNKFFVFIIALFIPALVQSAAISEPASLRETLPMEALGYVRIPSPWGIFSAPKDNALKGALENEQHVQQIQKLENSFYQNVLKKGEHFTHPALTLFFHHLRSPIEAVLLLPKEAMSPMLVNVLISAKLNFTSIEALNKFLKKMVDKTPYLDIQSEVSAEDGYGILTAEFLPIFIHYDVNTQTLSLMAGLTASPEQFKQTRSQKAPIQQHPMYGLENRIDTSRQGYFSWINLEKILPLLTVAIEPEIWLELQKWGLFNLRGAALGWGVKDGKGRLSFMIDAPRAGYREFFPAISNNFSITTSGKPGIMASLSIPALEWFKGAEKILMKEAPDPFLQEYPSLKNEFESEFGFSIEEALGAFGPEMVFFTDEVGEFIAIKMGEAKLVQKIRTALLKKYELAYEVRTINDKAYHHLIIPASLLEDFSLEAENEGSGEAFLLELVSKINTHYYWVEEEGYLVLASLPQLLVDRQRHQERVNLQQWLKQEQGQDIQSSLLVISTNISNIPRRLYYTYLQILSFLGELSEEKVDLFALPTANELNLPNSGTYALQMDLSDSLFAVDLVFENNPLEFLFDHSMMGVAAVGILAAVAIPAYADYLKRAKVAEALNLLNSLKTPAEEYFTYYGRLPEVEEIGGITSGQYTKNIRLLESNNGYSAEFEDPDLSGMLILQFDSESYSWTCTHQGMSEELLPEICRETVVSWDWEDAPELEEQSDSFMELDDALTE
jgi:hypothetical protein